MSTEKNRKVIGKETQKLRVDLTEAEIKRANESLIGCLSDIAAHEREATEVKAQITRKQKGLEAKRGNLHQLIVAGYEYRDVAVERIADYDAGLIRLVRVDTGAEVDVERMAEGVRQQELDLREKRDADASRPTSPDDIGPDVDPWGAPSDIGPDVDPWGAPSDIGPDVDPWGAPSDGSAPVAELPHDPDVIDAEFVEGDAPPDAPDAPDAHDAPAPPAGESLRLTPDDEAAARDLVAWMKGIGAAPSAEHLESCDPEEVRDIYQFVTGEPAGRAQKRTLIPKIVESLFPAAE